MTTRIQVNLINVEIMVSGYLVQLQSRKND